MNASIFTQSHSHLNGKQPGFRNFFLVMGLFIILAIPGSLSAQGEIINGGNHNGSIAVDTTDSWTFSANEGEKILMRVGQLSGGTGFDPRIRIMDEGGLLVGYATGGTSSTTSMAGLELVTPSTGDFTITVDSALNGGGGTYRLYFLNIDQSFTVAGGDHGGEITSGISSDGSISVGDLDVWTFQTGAADRVTMNARQLSGADTFSPKLRIFDPAGNLVAYSFNPDSSTTSETEVVFITATEGEYRVVVESGYPEGSGTFRLTHTLETGPVSYPEITGTALDNGKLHEGNISVALEVDAWTFPAQAGDHIQVRLGETDNGTGLTPQIELFAPDESLLASDSAIADGWVEAIAKITGTYSVQIADIDIGSNDENDDVGSYRLEAIVLPGNFEVSSGDEGGELTIGGLHEAAIHVGDIDTWTIQADAGDTIQVRLGELDNGTGFLPYMELRGSDGVLLSSDTSPADCWVSAVAPVTGTYYVQVLDGDTGSNDENDDTGSYRLEAVVTPGDFSVSVSDEGGGLTKGRLHEGVIHVGDIDTWTVQAEAGDTILARIGETDNGSGLNPYTQLRGPDGALLDFDTSITDSWVSAVASETGTYFIQITDNDTGSNDDHDDTGSYRLEVTVLPGTFEVSVGDEGGELINGNNHEGTMHVGDVDTWILEAEAGNTIYVRVGEIDNGTGLNPYISLSGPDGILLEEATHASDAVVTAVAGSTGTYYVQIADNDTGSNDENDDTGSYRLESLVASTPVMISEGDEGGPLPIGLSEGTLVVGDLDAWTFEAVEEDHIRLQLVTETAFPLLKVFDSSGAEVASAQTNSATRTVVVEFDTESTGLFTVLIQSLGNGASGDYDLTFQRYIGRFMVPLNDPSGWGGWSVSGSLWQLGTPIAGNGPPTFDGSSLMGTLLAENYYVNANALLASPPFYIPPNGQPQFTYQQWFSTTNFFDYGQVQVRREGGDWTEIEGQRVSGSETEWTENSIELSPYGGDTIQIGFRFVSDSFPAAEPGWFIDNVQLDIPIYTTMDPLDPISSPNVRLSWGGNSTDGAITGYDVYVRTDGGAWQLWLENTMQTTGHWQGMANRRYGFYVTAKDSEGASVPAPDESTDAQVETDVVRFVKVKNMTYASTINTRIVSFNLIEGEPGDVWTVRRATSIKGPWNNAGIVTIDENGNALFEDNNALPPDTFYQAVKPD